MAVTPGPVAAVAALALALAAFVVWLYRQREPPVGGRGVLAALRVAAVLVVLLLLLDPPLPGSVAAPSSSWTLIDGSLSMWSPAVPTDGVGDDVSMPWSRARELAREASGPTLVFGADAGPFPTLSADGTAPPDTAAPGARSTTSRLTPALERAAEAGARRITVISDLRLEDAREAADVAERLGLAVEVRDVGRVGGVGEAGPELRNAAVETFRVPPALTPGEEVPAEVTVGAAPREGDAGLPDGSPTDEAPDSATVEIREGDRLVASRRVALPAAGRRARLELTLPAPAGGEESRPVRWEARVILEGDVWPDDDARPVWSEVDPEEGALVLLAAEPDWEPRFLLPVLGSVTGLRTRGLLRVGPDRWLVMEEGGAGGTVDDERAAREARGAELLVVQGGGREGPGWLPDVVDGASRVLVLARDPADAALADVETGPAVPGEWYVSAEVPSSPLAGSLAGVGLDDLPPLGPVLPLRDGTARPTVALDVRRGGGAAGEAALLLRDLDGVRRAVALAPGWWRWAFRPPRGRDPYRRVWAGVSGWLMTATTPSGAALRPVSRVVPRGASVEWRAGGARGDSVSLAITRGDSAVLDTTAAVPESGRLVTPPLPPGRYEWRATDAAGADMSGPLEVEAWTAEMLHPRATDLARSAAAPPGAEGPEGSGPPLRTHPLPYLLLLALLSAEWIGRRRQGLR